MANPGFSPYGQDPNYEKKYFLLKRKCETIELHNDRLTHRLRHVQRMEKRLKVERRFLMSRLDQHGDSYKEDSAILPYDMVEDNLGLVFPVQDYALSQRLLGVAGLSGLGVSGQLNDLATLASGQGRSGPAKRKGRDREVKDPNAPKKPVNAYVMFFQQKRQDVQAEYFREHQTEIGNHDLTRIVGQQWKKLSTEEKKVYFDLYEKDKGRYQKEMLQYSNKEIAKKEQQETMSSA